MSDKNALFIDTAVFLYAAGQPHRYKDACVRILADVEQQRFPAVITTEVLQELLHRAYALNMEPQGIQLCRNALALPFKVIPISKASLALAFDLLDQYREQGLQLRTAIHAAALQHHELSRVISTDPGFDLLDFVTRTDPADV